MSFTTFKIQSDGYGYFTLYVWTTSREGGGGFQEKSEKEKLVKKETMITARTIKDERTGPFMLK